MTDANAEMSYVPIRRALLSVSNKDGVVALARRLVAEDVELISTGGTAKAIEAAGLPVRHVEDVTGFPEIMDGRVKTLHPHIHGGLLAVRSNPSHKQALAEHGIGEIDLVVVNLYPFEETLDATDDAARIIENIDIGGPSMLRSAAKNHAFTTVLVDPADYDALGDCLTAHNCATPLAFRRRMAMKAFQHTAAYDAVIAGWFQEQDPGVLPEQISFSGRKGDALRYGENPHQQAAFYRRRPHRYGVATAEQVQGKTLSYNNLNDTDAAFELVAAFDPAQTAACAIIKHANPCGVATGPTLQAAYERAFACDPVSAFGGIIAFNQCLNAEAATAIGRIFTEVIIAPDADAAAKEVLAQKKNLRLLLTGGLPDAESQDWQWKSLAGGFLVQQRDHSLVDPEAFKVVSKRAPSEQERADLLFAFTVASHVKSNAIVYAKNGATVGIGAGQMSRVDSARIAALKAKDVAQERGQADPDTLGSVVASDAFFPFADGLLAAADAGATAVIQPGGSRRDPEVIAAADDRDLAMIFTGRRHFRH